MVWLDSFLGCCIGRCIISTVELVVVVVVVVFGRVVVVVVWLVGTLNWRWPLWPGPGADHVTLLRSVHRRSLGILFGSRVCWCGVVPLGDFGVQFGITRLRVVATVSERWIVAVEVLSEAESF